MMKMLLTHKLQFVLCALFLIVFQISCFANEIDKPQSILFEVNYDEKNSLLNVQSMQLSNKPAPKIRNLNVERGQLLCQLEDSKGNIIASIPIKDPSVLHADWLEDPNELESSLQGRMLKNPNPILMLSVPFYAEISRIKISKPHFGASGDIESYSELSAPVP